MLRQTRAASRDIEPNGKGQASEFPDGAALAAILQDIYKLGPISPESIRIDRLSKMEIMARLNDEHAKQ